MPLICRFPIPFHRFRIIMRDALSVVVGDCQVVLGGGVALLCGCAYFLQG